MKTAVGSECSSVFMGFLCLSFCCRNNTTNDRDVLGLFLSVFSSCSFLLSKFLQVPLTRCHDSSPSQVREACRETTVHIAVSLKMRLPGTVWACSLALSRCLRCPVSLLELNDGAGMNCANAAANSEASSQPLLFASHFAKFRSTKAIASLKVIQTSLFASTAAISFFVNKLCKA